MTSIIIENRRNKRAQPISPIERYDDLEKYVDDLIGTFIDLIDGRDDSEVDQQLAIEWAISNIKGKIEYFASYPGFEQKVEKLNKVMEILNNKSGNDEQNDGLGQEDWNSWRFQP